MTHVEHLAAKLRRRHKDLHVFRYEGHVDPNSGVERADEIGPLDELALGGSSPHDAVEGGAPPGMDRNQLVAVLVAQQTCVTPDIEQGTDPAAFQRIDYAIRIPVYRDLGDFIVLAVYVFSSGDTSVAMPTSVVARAYINA